MIDIRNLSKSYNGQIVLDNVSLSLPNKGLVAITGPSGCGKTTFLNCLSSLIKYEGKIIFNNTDLSLLNDNKLDEFRLYECGFVFQDFKLFTNETAFRNVLFPLEVISSESKGLKEKRVNDLLKLVGMYKSKDQLLSKMSGGEKQRVAIARAMVNNPKVFFADEPTGSLDSVNSLEILKILKTISSSSLVIVVSHDEKLISQYADRIISLKDGQIIKNETISNTENVEHLPLIRVSTRNKKPIIPFSFLFRHSYIQLKEKKNRNVFTTVMTSLGLLTVGLTLSLSSMVNSAVKESYAALIDEDQIIIGNKNEPIYKDIESAPINEVTTLKNKLIRYVDDIGVYYYQNFETFFSTRNQFYVSKEGSKDTIEGLSARNVNEFRYLQDSNETFYPNKPSILQDDEIVLSLTIDAIEDICFALRIPRSVRSLSDYLLGNDLFIVLDVANDNWQYEDEQILNIKAFSLSYENFIYHTNKLWNQYMFEDMMRFPTSPYLYKPLEYPYILRKIYYLDVKPDDIEKLFIYKANNSAYDKYKFELASKEFYPYLYQNMDIKDINRVFVFKNNSDNTLTIANTEYIKKESLKLTNEIYGTNKGIAIYSESLLMGFANNMFVSSSKDKIDEVNDINSYLSLEESRNLVVPSEVSMGCYYKVKSQGLTFYPLDETKDISLDEIIISSSLAKSLFDQESPIGKTLYLSYVVNEKNYGNKKILKEFANDELKIVGVIDSPNHIIYHNPYWSILYFQLHLGISVFDLDINKIAFSKKEDFVPINTEFPQYLFVEPLSEINASVDEVVNYLTIALVAFSIVCIIIAILLILLINNLNIIDNKKDISLSRILGISKKESKRFLTTHTLLVVGLSLLFSIFELVIISFIINKFILSGGSLTINPLSFVAMFFLSILLILLTSFISSFSYKKLLP